MYGFRYIEVKRGPFVASVHINSHTSATIRITNAIQKEHVGTRIEIKLPKANNTEGKFCELALMFYSMQRVAQFMEADDAAEELTPIILNGFDGPIARVEPQKHLFKDVWNVEVTMLEDDGSDGRSMELSGEIQGVSPNWVTMTTNGMTFPNMTVTMETQSDMYTFAGFMSGDQSDPESTIFSETSNLSATEQYKLQQLAGRVFEILSNARKKALGADETSTPSAQED